MNCILLLIYTVTSPVAVMREKPEDDSRVVSQAIFSEEVKLLEERGEWVKIESAVDNYQGWAKKEKLATIEMIPEKTVMIARPAVHVYSQMDTEWGPILTLPFESRLELLEELPQSDNRWLKVRLLDGRIAYVQRGDCSFAREKLTTDEMIKLSMRFLGLPYTWGGRSSFGYDCSGFVQMLYRQMGIFIPRDSKDQYTWKGFQAVAFDKLQPGDLIFWGKSEQQINHVGLYIGNNKFIHTIATVEKMPYLRISDLDDPAWRALATNSHPFRQARKIALEVF